jgi:hypothetical protein
MQIGEIAAPAPGNPDFFCRLVCVINYHNGPATIAGFDGAHQTCRTGANNDYIEVFHGRSILFCHDINGNGLLIS